MSYEINFTDSGNKSPITIEDKEIDASTSLKLPGKYATAYGPAIAENFLHLMENFASEIEPQSPVEGQLWYETTPDNAQLKIYNGTQWVAASGVKKGAAEPDVATSLIGDLWADTTRQQLFMYTGSSWILVGPAQSESLFTGAEPVIITSSDDQGYVVLRVLADSSPIAMISASTFVPKITIPGFDQINTGITLSSTVFESGVAKFYGVSEKAEALVVGNSTVPAENFLRADQNGTITGSLTIDSEDGIFIGTNSASQILHSDGKLYLKTSTAGEVVIAPGSTPVVTVSSTGKLGLNKSVPVDTLDVVGTASVSQTLNVGDNIIAQGNASIAGDISVSGSATVAGVLVSDTIVPSATNSKNIGSATNVFATVYANSFRGNLIGNVTGAVNGSATTANKLSNTTTFRMTGDVTAAQFTFDGQSGGTVKTFNTVIGAGLIANKTLTATSNNDDQLLINKVSGTNRGLFRITKQSLLGNIPRMPAGIIMPYGGNTAPAGWLFCYGQLLTISSYSELFSAIGYAFKDQGLVPAGKFALPDFRGRSPVGLDNMGGSRAGVIPGTSATELGNIGGAYNAALSISNLPEHEHDMKGSAGTQYYAINDQNSVPPDAGSFRGQGPDDGNDAQYLPSSGGIKTTGLLGQPFSVMNPFVAVNYIIYTGKE